MANEQVNLNHFRSFFLFLRNLRLLRRMARRNKEQSKHNRWLQRQKDKKERAWSRRRKRRIIKTIIRSWFRPAQKPKQLPIPVQPVVVRPYQAVSEWARRKRIIRFLLRRFWKNLLSNEKKHIPYGKTSMVFNESGVKATIVLNSLACFVMAYLIIQLAGQALTYVFAFNFDYTSTIRYYGVVYFMTPRDWTPDAVLTLQSIQPFTGLILGLLSLIAYLKVQHFEGVLKMLFLWMFVCGMIAFFGALAVGTIFTKGFGHVIVYLYFMDTAKLIFSMLALGVLLLSGTFSRPLFLNSANTYFMEVNQYNVKPFVRLQVIYPYMAGTILLLLFKLPGLTYYEGFMFITFLVFLLPLWLSPGLVAEQTFEANGELRLRKGLVIASFLFLILYRILTA